MGPYTVTYLGDSTSEPNHYYKVNYKRFDASGKIIEEFELKPHAQINPQMGLTSAPDTKHYLTHDLYTHVTALPQPKAAPNADSQTAADHGDQNDDKNYDPPITNDVAIGDTIRFREGYMIVKALKKETALQNIPMTADDIAVGAQIQVFSNNKTYTAEPVYMIRGKNGFDFSRTIDDIGLKLRLAKILPDKSKVEILVYQTPENKKPWIVMRALDFPYINFLWSGTVIMIIGFLLSIFRRNKELKTV
jgi:cytochrome c-type biogenesis protein CcmF